MPALRALRRALPHRRLGHAEVPAECAQDGVRMPAIKSVNDFVVKFANVNGSGSASANEMFARSILRMGVPVTSRNIFPSNIQGLAHLVRSAGLGPWLAWPARRRGPDGGDEPPDLGQGCRLDRSRRLSVLRFLPPHPAVEIPRRHQRLAHAADGDLQCRLQRSAPAPAVQEHHLYRRAGPASGHRDRGAGEADRRAIQGQGRVDRAQSSGAAHGP